MGKRISFAQDAINRQAKKCQHTPCPEGYLQWQEWARVKSHTHIQQQCTGCGLYAVWVPRPSQKDSTK